MIRGIILDMDGVLWRGSQPIVNLPEVFEKMAAFGWRVVLATNNATLSTDHYLKKFARFGVKLEPWQVINSGQAAALTLKERFPQGGEVYIVGEAGLAESLKREGFVVGGESPVAVVVGMDRELTYEKLRRATLFLRAGALFVGTNPDVTFPTPEGLVPGTGATLAALEAASGKKPLIVGKPEPIMYRIAIQRLGTTPQETLVVGDRLETDIVGAQRIGAKTALVLSGVTSPQQARDCSPPPHLIAKDLPTLLQSFDGSERPG